ncbi:non-specific lipid transfer protein GPI-anchored 12-like isoform X1 [Malus sylvestris]|uniref:non-specific lipid transfer protein GPI-anchored 12-like isoform X1 n=1 Tax=Malus sylvestris TaxID=3752 RepID=UPI0021AD20AA|nr:non-specific lipid transfer protein GPI-anchored 12-like isoform X1 [Malus sylvestris]
MGKAIVATGSIMLLMTILVHGVSAQPAPAPAPATTDCYTSLLGLSDCLTYVEEGSNLTKPDKPCCPELAGLVKDNPVCLCYLLGNTSSSLGFQIDTNRALKLPTVCKVDTPPASTCTVLGIPVSAPIASEGPNSPDFAESPQGPAAAAEGPNSPDFAESPQGPAAAARSPEANKDKNGASRTADSVIALLGGLAIAILPAFF